MGKDRQDTEYNLQLFHIAAAEEEDTVVMDTATQDFPSIDFTLKDFTYTGMLGQLQLKIVRERIFFMLYMFC